MLGEPETFAHFVPIVHDPAFTCLDKNRAMAAAQWLSISSESGQMTDRILRLPQSPRLQSSAHLVGRALVANRQNDVGSSSVRLLLQLLPLRAP